MFRKLKEIIVNKVEEDVMTVSHQRTSVEKQKLLKQKITKWEFWSLKAKLKILSLIWTDRRKN